MDFTTREDYLKRHRIGSLMEDCVHYILQNDKAACDAKCEGKTSSHEFILNPRNPIQYLPQSQTELYCRLRERLLQLQQNEHQRTGNTIPYCVVLCSNRLCHNTIKASLTDSIHGTHGAASSVCTSDETLPISHAAKFIHSLLSAGSFGVVAAGEDARFLAPNRTVEAKHALKKAAGGAPPTVGRGVAHSEGSLGDASENRVNGTLCVDRSISQYDMVPPGEKYDEASLTTMLQRYFDEQKLRQAALRRQRRQAAVAAQRKRREEEASAAAARKNNVTASTTTGAATKSKQRLQQRLNERRQMEEQALAAASANASDTDADASDAEETCEPVAAQLASCGSTPGLASKHLLSRVNVARDAMKKTSCSAAVLLCGPMNLQEALFVELSFGLPSVVLWLTAPCSEPDAAAAVDSEPLYFDFDSSDTPKEGQPAAPGGAMGNRCGYAEQQPFLLDITTGAAAAQLFGTARNSLATAPPASLDQSSLPRPKPILLCEDEDLAAVAEYFHSRGLLVPVNVLSGDDKVAAQERFLKDLAPKPTP